MEGVTGANFCSEMAAVSAHHRIRDLTIEEPEIKAIVRLIYEEGL